MTEEEAISLPKNALPSAALFQKNKRVLHISGGDTRI